MSLITLNVDLNKLVNYKYLESLEWFDLDNIRKAPRASGCYMLIENGVVMYVGKSTNIKNRMGQHIGTRGKQLNNCTIRYTLEDNPVTVAVLEMVLVSKYLPEWNHEVKLLEKL